MHCLAVLCVLAVIIAALITPLSEPKCVTATPVSAAKSIGVSGVRLPWPLCVTLPVARRHRLGRPPPQRGEEKRRGAGRRRWLRLVAAVTRSYLFAVAGLNVGLMVGGDV